MIVNASVSRAILLGIFAVSFYSPPVVAQDVEDMSAYMGYRGYTTYRNQERQDNYPHLSDPYSAPALKTAPVLDGDEGGIQINVQRSRDNKSVDEQASRLEDFYRKRTGDKMLSQFGYDLFYSHPKGGLLHNKTTPAGAVQNDYIMQAGDEVQVIFSGERRDRQSYKVGSDGRLMVEGLSPVMAMGRPLGEVKKDIQAVMKEAGYYGSADVIVSAMKQVGVLIAGHVHEPGRHNLNAYHSVLDALSEAGGIKKSGSLRNIKLIRNGTTQYIDLYSFIGFNNVFPQILLQDGDRIIVPPVGATIAVTGDVKQAGIFEMQNVLGRPKSLSLHNALAFAGGPLGGGNYLFTMIRGNGEVVNIGEDSRTAIQDGSVIRVMRAEERLVDGIELKGYSRRNGIYDLAGAGSLRKLFHGGKVFGDDTYPLMGIISRVNRGELTRNLIGFSPQAIAKGKDDRQLESGDIVYLFSNKDIESIINNSKENNFPKVINKYIQDNLIRISGAVREEGAWPVATVTDLQTLLHVAGGLTSKASRNDIEITSRSVSEGEERHRKTVSAEQLENVLLEPGDQVRVNERFEKAVAETVRITGEVKYPGNYDLMRGDTLLSLLERAGGLTQQAYPPAAVFSRKRERKREEQRFRAAAQELEQTVSINLNAKDKGATLTPAQISMARNLAEELREVQGLGRVMVEADPAVLSVKPELNMLLEDGDHLHIPKRSLNVRVSGEVMNPVSLLFEEDKEAEDYIRQAGGTSYYADKGRAFVVYPDGSAEPLGRSWNSHDEAMIIPGSTIIIPRDPKPFNFMDSFKDITQILSNMAITGVFIEDIANDEN